MQSMAIFLLLAVQLIGPATALFPRSDNRPVIYAKQGTPVHGNEASYSNMSMVFPSLDSRALFERQLTCVTPGYVLCPDLSGCCPAGDTCVTTGCCSAGEDACGAANCFNPSTSICCADGSYCPIGTQCFGGLLCCPLGEQPCGSDGCYNPDTEICCITGGRPGTCDKPNSCCGEDYCYDPTSETCCDDNSGSCDNPYTCCGTECCGEGATCGSNRVCSALTCTVTSTTRRTSYATRLEIITKITPPPEAPDFSCVPSTVTNDVGDELEQGDDCGLTLSLADTDSDASLPTATDGFATTTTADRSTITRRQLVADCAVTRTSIATFTVHTITTVLSTVTRPDVSGFTCLPMAVVNPNGDELKLNEECAFEFTPGEGGNNGGQGGNGGPSGAIRGMRIEGALVLLSFVVGALALLL